ncbi:hypothetical protein RUND412_006460 [Rhizina undulata]
MFIITKGNLKAPAVVAVSPPRRVNDARSGARRSRPSPPSPSTPPRRLGTTKAVKLHKSPYHPPREIPAPPSPVRKTQRPAPVDIPQRRQPKNESFIIPDSYNRTPSSLEVIEEGHWTFFPKLAIDIEEAHEDARELQLEQLELFSEEKEHDDENITKKVEGGFTEIIKTMKSYLGLRAESHV